MHDYNFNFLQRKSEYGPSHFTESSARLPNFSRPSEFSSSNGRKYNPHPYQKWILRFGTKGKVELVQYVGDFELSSKDNKNADARMRAIVARLCAGTFSFNVALWFPYWTARSASVVRVQCLRCALASAVFELCLTNNKYVRTNFQRL